MQSAGTCASPFDWTGHAVLRQCISSPRSPHEVHPYGGTHTAESCRLGWLSDPLPCWCLQCIILLVRALLNNEGLSQICSGSAVSTRGCRELFVACLVSAEGDNRAEAQVLPVLLALICDINWNKSGYRKKKYHILKFPSPGPETT